MYVDSHFVVNVSFLSKIASCRRQSLEDGRGIGSVVRADFRRLYPANAKTPTCCPSDDNRTKVTNSVTSARSLWWHVGPYFLARGSDADGEPRYRKTSSKLQQVHRTILQKSSSLFLFENNSRSIALSQVHN